MAKQLYSNTGEKVASISTGLEVDTQSKPSGKSSIGRGILLILLSVSIISTLIFGITWIHLTKNQYTNVVGGPMRVTISVTETVLQTDTRYQENADVYVDTYHLAGMYDGRNIVLLENYIDKEQADSFIGENRRVVIDKSTYKELVSKGVPSWPATATFVSIVASGLFTCIWILNQKKGQTDR